jgi:hypothetical protein
VAGGAGVTPLEPWRGEPALVYIDADGGPVPTLAEIQTAAVPVRDPGHLTAAEADASRAYRGCPLGMHEPGREHHYTCWAEFL